MSINKLLIYFILSNTCVFGQGLETILPNDQSPKDFCLSPTNNTIYITSPAGISVIDVRNKKTKYSLQEEIHKNAFKIAVLKDSSYLIFSNRQNQIIYHNFKSNISKIIYTGTSTITSLAPHPNKFQIGIGNSTGETIILDIEGNILFKKNGDALITDIVFDDTAENIHISDIKGNLLLINLSDKNEQIFKIGKPIFDLDFFDNNTLIAGSNGRIRFYKEKNGAYYKSNEIKYLSSITSLSGIQSEIICAYGSATGKIIIQMQYGEYSYKVPFSILKIKCYMVNQSLHVILLGKDSGVTQLHGRKMILNK